MLACKLKGGSEPVSNQSCWRNDCEGCVGRITEFPGPHVARGLQVAPLWSTVLFRDRTLAGNPQNTRTNDLSWRGSMCFQNSTAATFSQHVSANKTASHLRRGEQWRRRSLTLERRRQKNATCGLQAANHATQASISGTCAKGHDPCTTIATEHHSSPEGEKVLHLG